MILAAVAGSAFFVFFIFLSIHRHLPGPSHNVRFYTDSVSYPLLNELGPPAQRITL
jgi:hypothetical protein